MEPNELRVSIKSFGILKDFIKDPSIQLPRGASLSDLMDQMIARHGPKFKKWVLDSETGEISSAICFLLNGKRESRLAAPLQDGDEVTLFIAISGGEDTAGVLSRIFGTHPNVEPGAGRMRAAGQYQGERE